MSLPVTTGTLSGQTISGEIMAPGELGVVEILRAFAELPDEADFPVEALQAALANPAVMSHILLALLDRSPETVLEVQDRAEEADDGIADFSHAIAMYLLAAFAEPRAFGPIIRFFHRHPDTDGPLSAETAVYVTGDLVTQDLSHILAATYDGEIGPLLDMIGDRACDEYARLAGVEAIYFLVAAGRIPRDEALAYTGNLLVKFRAEEVEEPLGELWWVCLVDQICRFGAAQLRPQLEAVLKDGIVSPREMTLKNIDEEYAKSWDVHVAKHYHPEHMSGLAEYLPDRLGWLAPYGLRPGDPRSKIDHTEANLEIFRKFRELVEYIQMSKPVPVKRAATKVGRNDPCACGSGKKYKKCCIDEA